MKKFALPVFGFVFTLAGLNFASAQTPPNQNQNTPLNTKGDHIDNVKRDSVDNMRLNESAQDKSVIRQQQRGVPDTDRGVVNPTVRDNTTLDNVPQSTIPQQASPSTTMPNAKDNPANRPTQTTTTQNKQTTSTHQSTQGKAQIGSQSGNGDVNSPAKTNQTTTTRTQTSTQTQTDVAPDRKMIVRRTTTTKDGKTIEKEYYQDYEVIRDNDRRYYMLNDKRIYFNDSRDKGNHGEMNNGTQNGDLNRGQMDNGNPKQTNDGMHNMPQNNTTTTPK